MAAVRSAALFCACACACVALLAACAKESPASNGFRPGLEPGMPRERIEAVLGKPQSTTPFQLNGNISAEIFNYPFGQVLARNGRVVAITIANEPAYEGPFGVTLGMGEDQLKNALHAHPEARHGHVDLYNLVVGQTNTRTKDIYDDTDGLILELAAANPNDPFAPFRIIGVTQADASGRALLAAITKAKVAGLYPDEQIINFTSDRWTTAANR